MVEPRQPSAGPRDVTRVLIVDDHPVVRRGLAAIIHDDPSLFVTAAAASVTEALEAVTRTSPMAAVVDLWLGTECGFDLIALLRTRAPQVRTIVLSAHDETVYADRALRAGAHGYVAKTRAAADLIAAIHRVVAGGLWFSEGTTERILAGLSPQPAVLAHGHRIAGLSDRERHVLELVGRGLTTRDIASGLQVSVKTIEAHYAHIKRKLSLRSGRELTRVAVLWTAGRRLD